MQLHAERVVGRPALEAFEFLADASNNPTWQRGMRSCEWLDDDPIAVGSTYRQEASFLGRPIVSTFEVVEYEPGRLVRIETIESTFPIDVTRRVTPIDANTCRVEATILGGPRVPGFLRAPMARLAQRSVDRDYDRLVALLGPPQRSE